jgi:hypothetical protein
VGIALGLAAQSAEASDCCATSPLDGRAHRVVLGHVISIAILAISPTAGARQRHGRAGAGLRRAGRRRPVLTSPSAGRSRSAISIVSDRLRVAAVAVILAVLILGESLNGGRPRRRGGVLESCSRPPTWRRSGPRAEAMVGIVLAV